jgi:hypothetical protein
MDLKPYGNSSLIRMMRLIAQGDPPATSVQLRSDPDQIPLSVAVVIEQCWGNDPEERPDAQAVINLLDAIQISTNSVPLLMIEGPLPIGGDFQTMGL